MGQKYNFFYITYGTLSRPLNDVMDRNYSYYSWTIREFSLFPTQEHKIGPGFASSKFPFMLPIFCMLSFG